MTTLPPPQKSAWASRLEKGIFFILAVLIHLLLFLAIADWLIFPAPPAPASDDFVGTQQTPVPKAPPVPKTVPTMQQPDLATPPIPTIQVANPASTFTFQPPTPQLPTMPSLMTAPKESGLVATPSPAGGSPGESDAGSEFGTTGGKASDQFTGYLYDFKQTRDGKPVPDMNPGAVQDKVHQFVTANWDMSLLEQYYKSPSPLSTASIFIPIIHAEDGPKAFGVEKEVQPNMYVVVYKVTAAPKQDGTYHFVGMGDDLLVARVDGHTVFDGSLNPVWAEADKQKQYPSSPTTYDATCAQDVNFRVGKAFHVSAGEPVDIEVLIGEEPGGLSAYFLYIQREESTYTTQADGTPLLPIFQVQDKPIHPTGDPRSFPPYAPTPEPWAPANDSL